MKRKKQSPFMKKWKSIWHRCILCGKPTKEPHHRTPQSRPQDLLKGIEMDSFSNVVPICRHCHERYDIVVSKTPTKSILHRPAMLANAQRYIKEVGPKGLKMLPQWLEQAYADALCKGGSDG